MNTKQHLTERTWEIEEGNQYPTIVTESQLREMEEDEQYDFMKQWFLSRYENPYEAGRPIDDETKDVMHFFGGPYDPEYELVREFEDIVPFERIEKLASEFAYEAHEWDGVENSSYFEEPAPNSRFYPTLIQSLDDVRTLLNVQLPPEQDALQCKMLYAHVITAMETYLADAFETITLSDAQYLQKFVETTPEYKETKIALAEIFDQIGGIRARAKKTIREVMWHNLAKVLSMYRDTLSVQISHPKLISKAISVRHDIVHRNGFSIEGKPRHITRHDVFELVNGMDKFIRELDALLPKNNCL